MRNVNTHPLSNYRNEAKYRTAAVGQKNTKRFIFTIFI